jgi:hypothetical protein
VCPEFAGNEVNDNPNPAGDPGDRVVKIVLIGVAVLFLLGCSSAIALFAMCSYM